MFLQGCLTPSLGEEGMDNQSETMWLAEDSRKYQLPQEGSANETAATGQSQEIPYSTGFLCRRMGKKWDRHAYNLHWRRTTQRNLPCPNMLVQPQVIPAWHKTFKENSALTTQCCAEIIHGNTSYTHKFVSFLWWWLPSECVRCRVKLAGVA